MIHKGQIQTWSFFTCVSVARTPLGCPREALSPLSSFQVSAQQLGHGELRDGLSPLGRMEVGSGPGQQRMGHGSAAVCSG